MRTLLVSILLLAAASSVASATLEARRAEFRAALEQAERGPPLTPSARRAVFDHPLYPYVEYAETLRDIRHVRADAAADVLSRHADLPFAAPLRTAWLRELARRRDWQHFLALYRDSTDIELQCHALQARLVAGRNGELLDQAAALWRHGDSRPAACDPAFAQLQAAGRIDAALRWERIELAAAAGNIALMRFVARGLGDAERARVDAYARFIETPTAAARDWPRDARSRQIATFGLERHARRDPAASEALLAALAAPIGLDDAQKGRVQYAVALWSAASYLPDAARRLAAVPTSHYDERLHEWRAREALSRGDGAAVLAAIAAMPATQRADGRWRYVAARMHEQLGQPTQSRPLLAALATEPNYYGFLAADHVGAPYALCPIEPVDDRDKRRELLALPHLQRALELHALGRSSWAIREWNAAVPMLGDDERRLAVALAVEAGWTDRAVFALAQGEDQRLYTLRFPLAHASHLRREARTHALDPAWVAALIRAESAWQPEARSSADARGLMQLLPGTAAAVAKRHNIEWNGVATLNQPRTNISLGVAYLAEMLQRHDGRPFLATAAYNAGPTPVARWRAQRPPVEPDLWVETIPYKETRDYVARIMAFAVIYDWRFGGRAVPVAERMIGRTGKRYAVREFACPPAAVAGSDPAQPAQWALSAPSTAP
jgi:soluble lytic murein transglycosylase